MILDALTRAEHERQLEKQPDLKFVAPVKSQKNNLNKIWLYIGFGVLANVLILYFAIRAISGEAENAMEIAVASPNVSRPTVVEIPVISQQNTQIDPQIITGLQQDSKPLAQEIIQLESAENTVAQQQQIQSDEPADSRHLAVGAISTGDLEVDRPLIQELKQPKSKSKSATSQPSVHLANAPTKSNGSVSFSSTELSVDDAAPIINKPKVFIDGVSNSGPSNSAPNIRDLPESSRSNLRQYEVNVHVFDDDPSRRFVLINMDKYKEGDRIANIGPLVEEITPAGVVVNYGNGRVLLPPK